MSQSSHDTAADGFESADLDASERYDLLSAERRRAALAVLTDSPDVRALDELAAAVAAREADGDAPDEEAVQRVAISLHHVHLPRMADAGVVDYDTESNRVETVRSVPPLESA